MQPSPRPIVVLNAHYTGLGIARSLHGLPVTVFGLTAETDTPARSSRDLRLVRSPDTEADPEGAARFLERFAADLQARPLLVPTRDHDVHFVMHHRARLEAAYDLPMAPNAVLERVLNKQALFEVARSVGIHCPVSVEVADDAQLEAALAGVAMPVVVKPLFSRDWRRPEVRRVVRKNKAFVFQTAGEVRELYGALRGLAPHLLVQEFVAGADDQLVVFGSYVDRAGVPRAHFTARKVLQHPRVCGNGVAIRAERMPADLTESSLALLRALEYRGTSELEFKREAGTGRLALIEMNARHWDQHRLSDAVGASVTRAMYEDWIGAGSGVRAQSSRDVTIIVEDAWLRDLADALRGREGSTADFLRLLRPPLRGALWHWRDPRPFFSMLSDLRRPGRRPTATHST
jgi:predicted ATP-grasp superfamily ATP-dependent carboligase